VIPYKSHKLVDPSLFNFFSFRNMTDFHSFPSSYGKLNIVFSHEYSFASQKACVAFFILRMLVKEVHLVISITSTGLLNADSCSAVYLEIEPVSLKHPSTLPNTRLSGPIVLGYLSDICY